MWHIFVAQVLGELVDVVWLWELEVCGEFEIVLFAPDQTGGSSVNMVSLGQPRNSTEGQIMQGMKSQSAKSCAKTPEDRHYCHGPV